MSESTCPVEDALRAFAARDHAKGRSILQAVIADAANTPEQQLTKFKALAKLAAYQSLMGEFEEAASSFTDAQAIAEALTSSISDLALAELYKDYGFLFDQQSQEQEAVNRYLKAKTYYDRAIADAPDLAKAKTYYEFLICYAKATEKLGQNELALAIYHDVLPIMESTLGVENGSVGLVRNGLARLLEKLGQAEAAQVLRQEERFLAGFKQAPVLMPLRDSVRALQAMGLLSGLAVDSLVSGTEEMTKKPVGHPAEIFDVLLQYYFDEKDGEARSDSDSYIAHDYKYRKETDDLPAELCKLIGQPILTQVSYKKRQDRSGQKRMCLGLRRDDGVGICVAEPSMEDVVEVFNAVLKERGDQRRFFQLYTEEPIIACYLLTIEEAQELSNTKAIGFNDMHRSLNATLDNFEKFTTWDGEIKPKHLKRFKSEGSKETRGIYTVNTIDTTTDVYDISQMPAKKLFEIDFDSVFDFGRSDAGDWYFIGRSKRRGFVGFNFLLIKNGQMPENGVWLKDSDTFSISSSFNGFYMGEILFLFDQGSHEIPKVLSDNQLVAVEGLTAPEENEFELDVEGTLVKSNSGKHYLMWADHFYRREGNQWKPCPEWHLPHIKSNVVPHGDDGFVFLSDAKPYLAKPGNSPKQLLTENFMKLASGPRGSVILYRPGSWDGGLRNLLLFPDSGREIDFTDEIFGFPNSDIDYVGYLPDTDKMVATTWDLILSFSAEQIV